ncbi:transketolase [Rhodospirillum rubrum]|uniref:transketolase n=1 Tax=Rhodospirillum rubrum TaxID=1085 RepID=UPI00190745AC|nr:transketolase [Rhodospirillum rubrum]MBK1663791.1 transketolase [Rhodospirillum rubrum]MBK1675870.1 transketolase [Rhodospirillum rubrum]
MTVTTAAPPPRADHGDPQIAERAATAIRMLAADAVEKAKSGHPGAPLGMADIAVALWGVNGGGVVRHNPANPSWPDRDRVVLSNGHASMLLYAVLHLTGYDLGAADLAAFRQFGSRTPGHPEVDQTPGVETTTGPLGQGLANGVGFALAEKILGETFNRPDHAIVDHHTWVLLGDGCLMEGISHEVASLAGRLGLGKLICLYDDNGISIDGAVEGWFSDDTPARFRAYGWQVIEGVDGHEISAVSRALTEAKADALRPTLICCRTVIGQGAPTKAGGHDVHGAPLGAAEIAAMRESLNWPYAPFEVPADIRAACDARPAGAALEAAWRARFAAYQSAYPELAAEFERRLAGTFPADFAQTEEALFADLIAAGTVASRKASQLAIRRLAPALPELLGASADLTGSNLTDWPGAARINDGPAGRYLSAGVREFGMAAVLNGMALHGGFIPFGGTFLVFSDYSRNAIRLAALMRRRVIHVLTHDSIGLGEDGPTHQPVEHAASLRLIPNLAVWRPGDAFETAVAWSAALRRADGPSALLLSRQNLPAQSFDGDRKAAASRGGYTLSARPQPRAIILASGSELGLATAAQALLDGEGIAVNVVSVPCLELFLSQPKDWLDAVLPPGLPRLAVEAAHPDPWWKVVGLEGAVIGMDRFGESAPAPELFAHFGFTPAAVAARLRDLLAQ